MSLNGHYCGNCENWTNRKKTEKGTVPQYGICKADYPKKSGQCFTRVHNGKKYSVRYNDFTIRTDGRKCKDWRAENG